MSVKLMGQVWDSDLSRDEKSVALAYADHASHDGSNIFPSVGLVAWKTGYSRRSVQTITKKLVEQQVLVLMGTHGRYETNIYHMVAENLPQRPAFSGGAEFAPRAKNDAGGVQKTTRGGAEFAPDPLDNHHKESSIYMSPVASDLAADFITELATIAKETLAPGFNEKKFEDAAFALIGWDAELSDIAKFGSYWNDFGWHNNKPALTNIINHWQDFKDGRDLRNKEQKQQPVKQANDSVGGVYV